MKGPFLISVFTIPSMKYLKLIKISNIKKKSWVNQSIDLYIISVKYEKTHNVLLQTYGNIMWLDTWFITKEANLM